MDGREEGSKTRESLLFCALSVRAGIILTVREIIVAVKNVFSEVIISLCVIV